MVNWRGIASSLRCQIGALMIARWHENAAGLFFLKSPLNYHIIIQLYA